MALTFRDFKRDRYVYIGIVDLYSRVTFSIVPCMFYFPLCVVMILINDREQMLQILQCDLFIR